MLNNALKKAYKLLNDTSLRIIKYAETNTYYLFNYISNDNKDVFDNCMIKVDKSTATASYYMISTHLEEIKNLRFKTIDEISTIKKK